VCLCCDDEVMLLLMPLVSCQLERVEESVYLFLTVPYIFVLICLYVPEGTNY